jgi:hypothetical protein
MRHYEYGHLVEISNSIRRTLLITENIMVSHFIKINYSKLFNIRYNLCTTPVGNMEI